MSFYNQRGYTSVLIMSVPLPPRTINMHIWVVMNKTKSYKCYLLIIQYLVGMPWRGNTYFKLTCTFKPNSAVYSSQSYPKFLGLQLPTWVLSKYFGPLTSALWYSTSFWLGSYQVSCLANPWFSQCQPSQTNFLSI